MNKPRWPVRLILALGILGALAALVLVFQRVRVELDQTTACPVMSYEDLARLARVSRETPEYWCGVLSDAGLQGLVMTPEQMNDPKITRLAEENGLSILQLGGISGGGTYIFDLNYDETGKRSSTTYNTDELADRLRQSLRQVFVTEMMQSVQTSGNLLVLVEKEAQTGVFLPEEWDNDAYAGRIAKGYWLNRWCRSSVGRLGYEDIEETENILYRSVIDRGLQVLWLMPISTEAGKQVNDPAVYARLLSGLERRLNAAGWRYGEVRGYAPYEPSFFLLLGAGLAVLLACVLLLHLICPLPDWALLALTALCVLENAAGLYLFRSLQLSVLALACAVGFPCLSAVLLRSFLQKTTAGEPFVRRLLGAAAACLGLSLLGGLIIAGLQSSRDYLLVIKLFRGVKISQAAVYGFSLLYFAWQYFRLPHSRIKRLREIHFTRRAIFLGLGLLILAAGVGVLFLLRTGDHMISVPDLELRMRNVLERALLFRPRTKEYLLAWPLLGLAFYFAARELRGLSALCGAFSAVGFASVANTFCHSRAHVLVSLARTGLGIVLGAVLTVLLLVILRLVPQRRHTEEAA